MKVSEDEIKIYNSFAIDLARGVDVVDRDTYEAIIDSRRKELLKGWLVGKNGLFLEYGCGDGSFSRFIKQELNCEVIGVDVSSGMVRHALTGGRSVNYLIADCHALPFKDKSFDAIVGMGIFHHLNLRKAVLECQRLLRRDGFLVAFEPNALCPLSFIGRRLFKTRIHTPNERTYTYWSFISEIRGNGFTKVELRFLSFFGFVFPFIWASKFAHLFNFLKRCTKLLRTIDVLFEKIPITEHFCWQFGCKCEF